MKEYNTVEVVAASAAIFQKHGFHKKRNPDGNKPSSARLYQYFMKPEDSDIVVTDAHRELAQDIILYFKGLTFKAIERKLSDFEANVLKAISKDTIPAASRDDSPANIGIVASLPKVYNDKLKQEQWADREAELARTSEYVGLERKFLNMHMRVENVRHLKDRFEEKILVCGSLEGKNVVKFFLDKRFSKCFNVGELVEVRGAVKAHQVSKYSGGKETMINRVDTGQLLERYEMAHLTQN